MLTEETEAHSSYLSKLLIHFTALIVNFLQMDMIFSSQVILKFSSSTVNFLPICSNCLSQLFFLQEQEDFSLTSQIL